jgi:hypothetical protein
VCAPDSICALLMVVVIMCFGSVSNAELMMIACNRIDHNKPDASLSRLAKECNISYYRKGTLLFEVLDDFYFCTGGSINRPFSSTFPTARPSAKVNPLICSDCTGAKFFFIDTGSTFQVSFSFEIVGIYWLRSN